MNWLWLRPFPWLDTRAKFIAQAPRGAALLDLGSSDGETLNHIAQLRPDLRLFAADKFGQPERYPRGCEFSRLDFEAEALPWADNVVDAVTCMHLLEHLRDSAPLLGEISRLLKPNGRVYFETPHCRTLELPSLRESRVRFTMNFHDDPTHVKLIDMESLSEQLRTNGLRVERSGVSRNWLFAAAHPFFACLPPSRKKYTAQVHWIGWSAYVIATKPS
ncbi:MAG TPA: class I SAM-dependent methyltransferase [Verrucomicrobiae bacterium]|nr:class I SAM-dependent methyltransferase [Verrucomicrobiae bacterium]